MTLQMWDDWRPEVREACLIALSLTGNANVVHDSVAERLTHIEDRIRLAALDIIHDLGKITPLIVPGLLDCLSDKIVMVRRHACAAASTVTDLDERVVNRLATMVAEERNIEVRCDSIRALAALPQACLSQCLEACVAVAIRVLDVEAKDDVVVEIARFCAAHRLATREDVFQSLVNRTRAADSARVQAEASRAITTAGRRLPEDTEAAERMMQIRSALKQVCTHENTLKAIRRQSARPSYGSP